MKTAGEISILEFTFQFVAKIWEPAAEAHKTRGELGISSLGETTSALERAGYEVCYVDLLEKVSGFAEVISDKRHIVLNRNKPPQDLEYTLPHELAHHVLHLTPDRESDVPGFPDIGDKEFEADLFATTWVLFLGNERQRRNALESPESVGPLLMCLFMTLVVVSLAVVAHLCVRFLPIRK